MFVASGLYRYATGSNATASTSKNADDTPSDTRVKRHPKRAAKGANAQSFDPTDADISPGSPPPSYASVASGATDDEKRRAKDAKIAVIDTILAEEDLYKLLGVKRNAGTDDIRRGFLNRSRSCHPDKFPDYPAATSAFQKVSFAYETLSKPSSRRMYDVSGRTDYAAAMNNHAGGDSGAASAGLGDDTLNGVLYSVFCEFMEGDFEMIRVLVNALNEGNPSMNLGDDAVDSIEGVFRRLRDVMFAGKRYLSIIKFELIRLYEIQQALRQLSYFNITGRLKLTLQLARVTINIPLAIDQAMKQPGRDQKGSSDAPGMNATQTGDSDGHSVSSECSSDEGDAMPADAAARKRTNRRSPAEEAFGVAQEDSGSDDQERGQASQRRKARRARRREQRRQARARIRHQRANSRTANAGDGGGGSESDENKQQQQQQQLQPRGLLPSTAVGLLKGVVRVLETSEAWVPGGK